MNKDNTVAQAGGFIIQLMPFTDEKIIDQLEKKLGEINSVTSMLDEGKTPEMILDYILGDFDVEIVDKIPTQFKCNCSKERVKKVLYSISKKEIEDIIKDNEPINVECHFCNTSYKFDIDELKGIL